MNIFDAIAMLDALPIAGTQRVALGDAAGRIMQAVQASLSQTRGADHQTPWLQTGALRDSITVTQHSHHCVIGSTSVVAVAQECGDAVLPPRPFLAPVAARLADSVVEGIGHAFAELFVL